MPYERILLAKVAWSRNGYQEGEVESRYYGYGKVIGQKKAGSNVLIFKGHEAFNFRKYSDKCYGFIPPMKKGGSSPKPQNKDGWLVVFFSKKTYDDKGLYIVGWYESATFCEEYTERPEYDDNANVFPMDAEGNKYIYCVKTQASCVYVPRDPINCEFIENLLKNHLKRQFMYVKGNPTKVDPDVRREIEQYLNKKIKKEIEKKAKKYIPPETKIKKEIEKKAKKYIPPETEIKEEIEEKAIEFATTFYEKKGYKVISVEKENRGWDLTCTQDGMMELHVEVKGTSRDEYHFFLSKNEYCEMTRSLEDENGSCWILCVVKNILSDNCKCECVPAKDVEKKFSLQPFCYEGSLKKVVKKKVKPLKRKVRKQQ